MSDNQNQPQKPKGAVAKLLDIIERVGNKLPDPAMLFLLAMIIVWILSVFLDGYTVRSVDKTGAEMVVTIKNQLTGGEIASFLSTMVKTFTDFRPLGVVLVAMLGVGIAEHSGYINAGLKLTLRVTPKLLLTPVLILVAIVSHTATDAGYVLVIPLGGIIYHAVGRHPLAGIAAAFAGVSGGFSANFIPSAIDPLLQSFTQEAAQVLDPSVNVNPLCNWWFTAASSFLIIGLGWFLTDRIIEPRLNDSTELDDDIEAAPDLNDISAKEKNGFLWGTLAMLIGVAALTLFTIPASSPMRTPEGELSSFSAPIMQSIVPLIFLLFMLPGVVHGWISGTFTKTKDIVDSMTKAMDGMTYYIVMAFFCALFIQAFDESQIGRVLAINGAQFLQSLDVAPAVTITGIIFLTAFVNLVVGSASAKWALIAPIFVPMLMQLGISPELTQAAYRVGDSSSNIITPLMPYFPLVVVFCQRYVKKTGIGTLTSMMLPYSIVFLVCWTLFLLGYWALGIPLGLQAPYVYPAP